MNAASRASWLPLFVVGAAQVLLAFNISALKISIDAIVGTYQVPASAVKNAIIAFSLVAASCILLGAKLAPAFGARRVFRITVALFGVAMLAMVTSSDARGMVVAQVVAGMACAAMVPTSISLIAESYTGERQARALEWLGAVRSISLVPAFLIAGALATWSDWRLTFALLVLLASTLYLFSHGLGRDPRTAQQPRPSMDKVGFALLVLAMLLIGLGTENLTQWGALLAAPSAPFAVLSLSPALLAIAAGLLFIKAFVIWSRKLRATGKQPLCSPDLIDAPRERSVLLSIFTLGAVSSAITFLIPLYIEIVQGRNSVQTAMALTPLMLASLAATMLVGKMRRRVGARPLARYSFLAIAAGLTLLGIAIRNDWSDPMVIVGMLVVGCGEGTLATLLFKVLITSTPREAAADIEPLCNATGYLAAAVGTALAGALAIGLLSTSVQQHLRRNPAIASQLQAHLDLDRVAFVSNDRLREVMERSKATPQQLDEAVQINTQARLRALKVSFFTLAGLALLAFIPALRAQSRPDFPPQ